MLQWVQRESLRIGVAIVLAASVAVFVASRHSNEDAETRPSDSPTAAAPAEGQSSSENSGLLDTPAESVSSPSLPPVEMNLRDVIRPEELAKIPASGVPVLLPASTSLSAQVRLVVTDFSYTGSMSAGDYSVIVTAESLEHDFPNVPPPTPGDEIIRGVRGSVSHSEGRWIVAWQESDVTYSLTLSCYRPFEHELCRDGSHARLVAESLVFVGGRP